VVKTADRQDGRQAEEEFESGVDVEGDVDWVQDQGSIPRTLRHVQLQTSQCGAATKQRPRTAVRSGSGR